MLHGMMHWHRAMAHANIWSLWSRPRQLHVSWAFHAHTPDAHTEASSTDPGGAMSVGGYCSALAGGHIADGLQGATHKVKLYWLSVAPVGPFDKVPPPGAQQACVDCSAVGRRLGPRIQTL
jgi:hypothetical protein